jgi:hypothetical protein
MDVVFAPAAAQDIEEIGDYIYAENPTAALHAFPSGLASDRLRFNAISFSTPQTVVPYVSSGFYMAPGTSRPS